jgi:Autophagy-related protein C terminal domain
MGIRDLTHGFMGGLKGIFVDPIRGAQEEGVAGLVKGARKGLMSALVKPTVGAIDLISRTAQGARNSAGPEATHRSRIRAPRYFGSDKVFHFISLFYFILLFVIYFSILNRCYCLMIM